MLIHSFAHAFTMLTMLTMLTWRSARRAKVPPAKSTSAASAAMRGLIHRRAAHAADSRRVRLRDVSD
jgi:hypothetical protein